MVYLSHKLILRMGNFVSRSISEISVGVEGSNPVRRSSGADGGEKITYETPYMTRFVIFTRVSARTKPLK